MFCHCVCDIKQINNKEIHKNKTSQKHDCYDKYCKLKHRDVYRQTCSPAWFPNIRLFLQVSAAPLIHHHHYHHHHHHHLIHVVSAQEPARAVTEEEGFNCQA